MRGVSRDRDVFARTYDGRALGEEVEVSPHEPEVEDHSDPSIAMDAGGNAWVAWSYDYHPQLFKAPEDADQPTIFARRLANGRAEGSPLLVGTRGENVHAVDLLPSIAVGPGDDIWCAWDGTDRQRNRCILVSQRRAGSESFGRETRLSDEKELSSSPDICVDKSGTPHVVWRQWANEHWILVGSHGRNGRWTEPAVWAKDEGDCRSPSLVANKNGGLWLVYEHQVRKDTEVRVKKIPG
jgi:hypothetical protein